MVEDGDARRARGDEPPAAGSYSSADIWSDDPATTRTRPSASSVAVCPARASVIEPAEVNSPVPGSNSSALANGAAVSGASVTSKP